MQNPTLSGVRIRSSDDVHRIFYGVLTGRLKILERRLDDEEREALGPGCVYVWEARGSQHGDVTEEGMNRFTEGKTWGPSRVRDDFLFYTQKLKSITPKTHAWDLLIKQTYSAWVETPAGRKKWHLVAYFTENSVDKLHTIDDIPSLRGLHPPPNAITSCRADKPARVKSKKTQLKGQLTPMPHPRDSSSSSSSSLALGLAESSQKVPKSSKNVVPPVSSLPISGDSIHFWDIDNNSIARNASSRHLLTDPTLSQASPPPSNCYHSPVTRLPPVDTFVSFSDDHGTTYRTPSSAGSVNESVLWNASYELASRHGGGALVLAPVHGPNRRVYVRDPLDDKALRNLPR